MNRSHTVIVDYDLSDFSDDDIVSEMSTRGLEDLSASKVSDLAFAIYRGTRDHAFGALLDLLAHDRRLTEAADIGRLRRR